MATIPERIVRDRWAVVERLAALGLKEEELLEAVQRGFSAWASSSPNYPKTHGGFNGWAETIAGLADALVPSGWRREDKRGWPLVVNASKSIAITVATANEYTGTNRDPLIRASKGPVTVNAVEQNLFLFPEMEEAARAEFVENCNTWFLLVHRDQINFEVRCELSLPKSVDKEGRLADWYERIILKATPFDGYSKEIMNGGGDSPKTGEITVEIKRRA